jgi:hypothetical protein
VGVWYRVAFEGLQGEWEGVGASLQAALGGGKGGKRRRKMPAPDEGG